jgi:hypothetical protein
MNCKAGSATLAAPKILALAATLALISSATIAHAATLTQTTDPTAVPIGTTNATVMGNTVIVPGLERFTDVTFSVSASAPGVITFGQVAVTGTGSDGASAGPSIFPVTNAGSTIAPLTVSQVFTFTGTPDLTSVSIATTPGQSFGGPVTVTGISFTGISGLSEIPLPASFPLFASGLGALGLLGWRRNRRAQAVA